MAVTACDYTDEINRQGIELNQLRSDRDLLKKELKELSNSRDSLELCRNSDKIGWVEISIKQTSFTLDIGEHVKNSANEVKIWVPVHSEFYINSKIGDNLADAFKWGSFFNDGDFTKLKVKIIDKQLRNRE
jgi:hypothetical protein